MKLPAALGYDLWALTQQARQKELNKTWQTQPALLTASVALYRVWQQQGGKAPALLAGVTASANTPRWFARALSVSLMPFAWLNCRQIHAGSCTGRYWRHVSDYRSGRRGYCQSL